MSQSQPDDTRNRDSLPLSERIGLRIGEAALMLGVSEGAFRTHVLSDPRCPRVYVGTAVVLPRRRFERYVEALAGDELEETKATAEELLERIE